MNFVKENFADNRSEIWGSVYFLCAFILKRFVHKGKLLPLRQNFQILTSGKTTFPTQPRWEGGGNLQAIFALRYWSPTLSNAFSGENVEPKIAPPPYT